MLEKLSALLPFPITFNPNIKRGISVGPNKYSIEDFMGSPLVLKAAMDIGRSEGLQPSEILEQVSDELKISIEKANAQYFEERRMLKEQEAEERRKIKEQDAEERRKIKEQEAEAKNMLASPSTDGLQVYIDSRRLKGDIRPEIRIFNPSTGREHITSEFLFFKKYKNWFAESIPCFLEYYPRLPHGPHTRINGNKEEEIFYNVYSPPGYRSLEITPDPKNIKMFEALLKHLFPLKKEREYFLFWARLSLTTKARTFLVLPGYSGIGKTLLAEILVLLHHRENVSRSNKSSFRTFNAPISKKSLVVYDEIAWDHEDIPVIKSYVEDHGPLELKGVDQRTAEYTASFIVCNNEPHKCSMNFDDRKFAVLKTTSVKLNTGIGDEYSNALHALAKENSEESRVFAKQIYDYILEKGDLQEKFPLGEYRGEEFYRICHLTMPRKDKEMMTSFLTPPDFLLKVMLGSMDKDGWMSFAKVYDAYYMGNLSNRRIDPANPNRVHGLLVIYTNLKGEKIFDVGDIDSDGLDFKFKFKVKPDFLNPSIKPSNMIDSISLEGIDL